MAALAFALVLASASAAQAQEVPRTTLIFQRTVPAPVRALEGQLRFGYAQGVGGLGGVEHVQDVAGVGFTVELGAGFRFSPRLYAGVYGAGSLYSDVQPDTSSHSWAAGVEGAWHFRPYRSLDPWIGFGAGYRTFLVNAPAGSSLARHAVDVARLAVGIDYRFNAAIAVGPVIGVDLALFLGDGGDATASNTGLSTFVTAGIAARFDFFGSTDPRAEFAQR
jgi:hypothetical protein